MEKSIKLKDFIKKNKKNCILLSIYAIITFVTILFHENWRDEAQSWLIAKNLGFIDIFKQMKYEGHPCLWHYIIAPFAKLGFPYITQNIIAWVIMCISTALILWKSEFDKTQKVLIIFGQCFIYLYSVVARNYCLIPLAICLIAITYKNRKEKPLNYILSITLLSYTHILMWGLVGVLYFEFFFESIFLEYKKKNKDEKKKIWICLSVAIIELSILFFQLYQSTKTNIFVKKGMNQSYLFIWQIIKGITNTAIGNLNNLYLMIIVLLITVILLIYRFLKFPKITTMMVISIMYQMFIFFYIYSDISAFKSYTVLLVVLFFECIYRQEQNKRKEVNKKQIYIDTFLTTILMLNVVCGIAFIANELVFDYSYSKRTAEYINENIQEGSNIVVSDVPHSSAIIPYAENYKYWSPQLQDYFTFCIWNDKIKSECSEKEFIKRIEEKYKNTDNVYFIYCNNWKEGMIDNFIERTRATLVFDSGDLIPFITDETYKIYKLYCQ